MFPEGFQNTCSPTLDTASVYCKIGFVPWTAYWRVTCVTGCFTFPLREIDLILNHSAIVQDGDVLNYLDIRNFI